MRYREVSYTPSKLRILAYLNRKLYNKIFTLKKRYEEIIGRSMSDSGWIEVCLDKGYPVVLGFIQSLEEEN